MNNTKYFMVLSLCILVLFVFLALGSGSDAEVTPTTTDDNGNDIDLSEEAVEDDDDEVVDDTSDNSRTNPAGLNESFTVRMDDWLVGKVTFEVEMVELISGDEAWTIIQEANMFNDEPGEGKEYIMAKFRIKVLETEEDEPFDLMMISWSAISGDGIQYDDFVAVAGVEPTLYNDLYEGAEHSGWKVFLINVEDDSPVVAMERRSPAEIWFDLRN